MVYLKSVENGITLCKLIVLLFLFCLPLLTILFLKTKRNDLARPVMGTIFLVYFTGLTVLFNVIFVNAILVDSFVYDNKMLTGEQSEPHTYVSHQDCGIYIYVDICLEK